MSPAPRLLGAAVLAALLTTSFPAAARPGGWGGGWNDPWMGGPVAGPYRPAQRYDDSREGRVETSHFVAEGAEAALLGHGPVTVTSNPGEAGYVSPQERAPFEAAVVDRLVAAGYDTLHADPAQGQVAELRVTKTVLVPAESKRSPVSGTAAMSVSNHGSAYGLGVNVDMTKPRGALVATRLEARIRDKASGKVLWEGHAQLAAREGDAKWGEGLVATKLAGAMFDGFPKPE